MWDWLLFHEGLVHHLAVAALHRDHIDTGAEGTQINLHLLRVAVVFGEHQLSHGVIDFHALETVASHPNLVVSGVGEHGNLVIEAVGFVGVEVQHVGLTQAAIDGVGGKHDALVGGVLQFFACPHVIHLEAHLVAIFSVHGQEGERRVAAFHHLDHGAAAALSVDEGADFVAAFIEAHAGDADHHVQVVGELIEVALPVQVVFFHFHGAFAAGRIDEGDGIVAGVLVHVASAGFKGLQTACPGGA